ncbi:MAG: hypothetical protein AB7K09_02805 [Planctomycetota bacterium]
MTLRLAIACESPRHDGLIIRRILEYMLGDQVTFVDHKLPERVSSRSGVLTHATLVAKQIHLETDADALLVVADLDQDAIPPAGANLVELTADDCAQQVAGDSLWCQLATQVRRGLANAPPRAMSDKALRFVIGVSIPAIEAWLLCPDWDEMKWRQYSVAHPDVNKQRTEKKRMKVTVYGPGADRRPPRTAQVDAAFDSLISSKRIDELAERFPLGIGQVVDRLRAIAAEA